jgi:hypothetical protein
MSTYSRLSRLPYLNHVYDFLQTTLANSGIASSSMLEPVPSSFTNYKYYDFIYSILRALLKCMKW